MSGAYKYVLDRLLIIAAAFIVFLVFIETPKTVILSPNFDTNYLHRYYVVADDSMITMRVAYNFARGLGPYFNPSDHIEANTSLFWPMMIAPLYRVVDLETAVLVISCLTVAITMMIFFVIGFTARSRVAAAIALGYLSLSTAFHWYGPSGWETIPQALFVTCGLCVLDGRLTRRDPAQSYVIATVLFAISFFMRPDSLAMMVILGLYGLYGFSRRFERSYAIGMVVLTAAVGIYFGLQLYFYHDLFPNTYYLKVGSSPLVSGVKYLLRCVYDSGATLVLVAGISAAAYLWRSCVTGARVALICLIAHIGYVVSVGGDVFGRARFLIILLPYAALIAADFIAETRRAALTLSGSPRAAVFAKAQAFLLFIAVTLPLALSDYAQAALHSSGRIVGKSLYSTTLDPLFDQIGLISTIRDKIKPEDGEIGLYYLGTLGYYLPEYKITDFLGKADSYISHLPVKWGPVGHNKWDITASLTRHDIAVIPFHLEAEDNAKAVISVNGDYAYLAETQFNPQIAERYTYLSPQMLGLNTDWGLYVRNDLVPRFTGNPPSAPLAR